MTIVRVGSVSMMLEQIHGVKDLRRLSMPQLEALAGEIRDYIIDVISENGGHLASSLGVVELTIALHYVFATPRDRIVWDVGHQTYAHKILTGRRDAFRTIRRYGGISGFPKMRESEFDTFDTGHSSTSLSLACGLAAGRDLSGRRHKVIAVIGDGSLTGGMAFEALNHLGHLGKDLIIILNDNEHSISKNVGAFSLYLTRMRTGHLYNRFRRATMGLVKRIPRFGPSLFTFIHNFFESFKKILVPGQLFEDMGVRYFGPIDGHSIPQLIEILQRVKTINAGPKIVHVITKKGKGYPPAEADPALYHGVGPFDRATGAMKGNTGLSYSEIAGRTLAVIARREKSIVAVTAAMKLGTGLAEFEKVAPGRFFDVGIAEQHAVTFAGALARTGHRPFVSIYSTFLQRAVDQLIHDIGIMNLPVRFLVDRAGVVGQDGETHHGLFDIPLLSSIPNFMIVAPSNGEELRDAVHFAVTYDKGPVAIRYPRGSSSGDCDLERPRPFIPGRIKRIAPGGDIALLALGDMVAIALETRSMLRDVGISASVYNILTVKPLDIAGIEKVLRGVTAAVTLENGVVSGGVGERILASVNPSLRARIILCAGFPDRFMGHGTIDQLFHDAGLDADSIARKVLTAMKSRRVAGRSGARGIPLSPTRANR